MAVLNTLAPIQTVNRVKSNTPRSPTRGCQIGMVTGEASRIIIMVGVNGGISARVVASGPMGSEMTGAIRNMGMMTGRSAGKVSACASLLSLQVFSGFLSKLYKLYKMI